MGEGKDPNEARRKISHHPGQIHIFECHEKGALMLKNLKAFCKRHDVALNIRSLGKHRIMCEVRSCLKSTSKKAYIPPSWHMTFADTHFHDWEVMRQVLGTSYMHYVFKEDPEKNQGVF